MSNMEIACLGCQKVYKIPLKKIPAKGAKVKCTKCEGTVVIPPPKTSTDERVICSSCQKVYKIPKEKIPAKGAKVKCTKCKEVVVIPAPKALPDESIDRPVSSNTDITVPPSVSKETAETSDESNNIVEKLKEAKVTAKAKGKEVKQLAISELNQLEKPKRKSLIIVASLFTFFILASVLKNVFLFGALFERLISIFFLLFFIFMILGVIRGVKRNIVVYYDRKDMFNAFKIIGALIATFIGFSIVVSTVIGPELYDTSFIKLLQFICCVSATSYFLYLTITSALQHNNNESVINHISAICAKVGVGVLFPAVILHEITQIGTRDIKDAYGNVVGTKTHSAWFLVIFTFFGGLLIRQLVNGEVVYEKRNAQINIEPSD